MYKRQDPEYAVAIRIANGYSSGNACLIANDIFKYMYNLADKDSILTGIASTDTSDTSVSYTHLGKALDMQAGLLLLLWMA